MTRNVASLRSDRHRDARRRRLADADLAPDRSPLTRSRTSSSAARAPVVDLRGVTSAAGRRERRAAVRAELSLANRSEGRDRLWRGTACGLGGRGELRRLRVVHAGRSATAVAIGA